MARRRKKQYGRGEVIKRGAGLAIRWREPVLLPDGSMNHVRRYLALGPVSRDEANRRLSEKLVASGSIKEPIPNVTFREHAAKWVRDVLPMYKFSVRESYRMILEKHLTPRFGDMLVSAGTAEASHFLINMQLTYIQTIEEAKRTAVEKIATQLAHYWPHFWRE